MLGVGAKKKVYLDDVFNNYLWRGNSIDNRAINVGFDYASEEGLVWIKNRQDSDPHCLFDTLRGANKRLASNTTSTETTTSVELKSFTSTGYTLGTDGTVNGNTKPFVSWNFKSAPGFFDVVQFTTSNSANQRIPHSLGSIPGMIIIKNLHSADNWLVYHRETERSKWTDLSNSDATATSANIWGTGNPTSTDFGFNSAGWLGNNSYNFIAYVFAGGESAAAIARSVAFDGSGDYLTQTCDAVLRNWWDQAFTVEYWVNADGFVSGGNGGPGVLSVCAPTGNGETWSFGPKSDGTVEFYYWNGSIQQVTTTRALNKGQWYHLAMCYDGSSSIKIYINGTLEKSATKQGTPTGTSTIFSIGKVANGSEFDGKVSNVRITHQALYTSSFNPPTEPLTQTSQSATSSNVKLLCCNNSSTTGSTVTPATISANGDPTASTDSPFDDPAGFVFGDAGDQNVIKCGSYEGNSTANHEIYVGWEPQWWLVKNVTDSQNWQLLDSMRGWVSDGNDQYLVPNNNSIESPFNFGNPTSTGFNLSSASSNWQNESGKQYVYMAIRRPDPLVQKPQLATDVFNMVMGTSNSDVPAFVSGFVTDFALNRQPATSENWWTQSRLTGDKYVITNSTAGEATSGDNKWDYNNGWYAATNNQSSYQSWMWKRHAGFDVVPYAGEGGTSHFRHGLSKVPEMMWVKRRNTAENWIVYHKGLNGGSSPEDYYLELNTTDTEATQQVWAETAPTATHFTVGGGSWVNGDGSDYIAMLFASVDGISKVGSFSGQTSTISVNLGFQPRFLFVKNITSTGGWVVLDTTRGWGSGNDNFMYLNSNSAQSAYALGAPTSTGFDMAGGLGEVNDNGSTYIYYAHA